MVERCWLLSGGGGGLGSRNGSYFEVIQVEETDPEVGSEDCLKEVKKLYEDSYSTGGLRDEDDEVNQALALALALVTRLT